MSTLLMMLAAWSPVSAASQPAPAGLGAWLGQTATSIVRVRVVLEATFAMGGQSEKQEFTSEVYGAVVDPSGLILLSNSHVSVARAKELMAAYGGGGADPGWNVVPTAFGLIDADGSNRPLVLVATDSDLDLAFLRLEAPPQSPMPAVKFAADVPIEVGDELRLIGRLGAGFGHAPWVSLGRIAGVIEAPRRAWMLHADDGMLGLPVFSQAGVPVGVLTTLFARGAEVADQGFGLAQMMSRFGGQGQELGPVGVFVLPGDVVRRLVERALAQADQVAPQVAPTAEESKG
jgi:hypothetical protein